MRKDSANIFAYMAKPIASFQQTFYHPWLATTWIEAFFHSGSRRLWSKHDRNSALYNLGRGICPTWLTSSFRNNLALWFIWTSSYPFVSHSLFPRSSSRARYSTHWFAMQSKPIFFIQKGRFLVRRFAINCRKEFEEGTWRRNLKREHE